MELQTALAPKEKGHDVPILPNLMVDSPHRS